MNKENLHKDHRKRLKKRFLNSGLKDFEPHNILELILFYSIPYKDVNPIAHALINEFGSISNIFNANFEELCKVDGISEHSATLLKLFPAVFPIYYNDINKKNTITAYSDGFYQILAANSYGKKKETVWLYLFDGGSRLIKYLEIFEGSFNSVRFSERDIFERAIAYNASFVAIAHNHPNGSYYPSEEDISSTQHIMSLLFSIGVKLTDHYIIGGSYITGMFNDRQTRKIEITEDNLIHVQ